MSQDTDRLRAGLEQIFADPLPPSSVDAAHLLERGHRLRRRRRAAGALSALAAVVVAAAVAMALPGVLAHPARPVSAGNGSAMLDPGRFGWLPTSPDTYSYNVGDGVSTVTAQWDNVPDYLDPELELSVPDPNQSTPVYTPMGQKPGSAPAAQQVGTIDGNPVRYYAYIAQLGSDTFQNFLAWKTASGDWAVLQDGQVHGADLLRVAATANTTPTPLAVPLLPTGDLTRLTAYNAKLTERPDKSALEYIVNAKRGDEDIVILGLAGTAAIASDTKCIFVPNDGTDSGYGLGCDTDPPPASLSQPANYVSKTVDFVDVYVGVFVNQAYDWSLSAKALTEVTSFGPDPGGWQPTDFS